MEQEMEFIPTTFDMETQSKNIQILKTIIPYMNGDNQKGIVFMVKYLELMHVMTMFNGESASLSMCSSDDPSENTMMLLNDLRKFCSQQEQDSIDMMLGAFQMLSTYDIFAHAPE